MPGMVILAVDSFTPSMANQLPRATFDQMILMFRYTDLVEDFLPVRNTKPCSGWLRPHSGHGNQEVMHSKFINFVYHTDVSMIFLQ